MADSTHTNPTGHEPDHDRRAAARTTPGTPMANGGRSLISTARRGTAAVRLRRVTPDGVERRRRQPAGAGSDVAGGDSGGGVVPGARLPDRAGRAHEPGEAVGRDVAVDAGTDLIANRHHALRRRRLPDRAGREADPRRVVVVVIDDDAEAVTRRTQQAGHPRRTDAHAARQHDVGSSCHGAPPGEQDSPAAAAPDSQ